MSFWVMPSSPLTPEHHYFAASYRGPLYDEPFDEAFSFLKSPSTDRFLPTPNLDRRYDPAMADNTQSDQSQDRQCDPQDREVQPGGTDVSPQSLSHLSLQEQQNADLTYQHMVQEVPFPTSRYIPFIPYQTAPVVNVQPGHFHPYRQSGNVRSPRFVHSMSSPIQTISGRLSISPPTSFGSMHPGFQQVAPPAVSPMMVSPASAIGSSLSDFSPNSMHALSLPTTPVMGAHSSGNDLTHSSGTRPATSGSLGPGLVVRSGFQRPTGRVTRSKQVRGNTPAGATIKREAEEEEGEIEIDSGDGDDGQLNELDPSNPSPCEGPYRDSARQARIHSEQKRRNELRDGFKRLKDALPHSNLKASKANLLDRAVVHIQALERGHREDQHQIHAARGDSATLRSVNAQLSHVIAQTTQAKSPAIPESKTKQ